MEKPLEITIMTESLDMRERVREGIKYVAGRYRKWGGHSAVTKGLIEGLDKIGYDGYNYRPAEKDIKQTVHVLGGIRTLKYAIKLKNEGRIKNLSAGPNVVIFSDDCDGIIASKEVDLFLTNSKWITHDYIRREPSLEGRIIEWPVGVDMEIFSPTKPVEKKNSKKVLIYKKDESDQFCWHVDYILKQKGYSTRILKYGEYTLQEYKELLDEAEFMVAISRLESQGIFMSEAWSMDVPTICFDRHFYRWPGTEIAIEGDITSCPYLAKENGISFMEIRELKAILDNWDEIRKEMHPREWCRENMSDIVCAKKFIDILTARFCT